MPNLQEGDAVGDMTEVDVEQHLLGELAYGDSLSMFPLPGISRPDIPLPEVPPDHSVGEG